MTMRYTCDGSDSPYGVKDGDVLVCYGRGFVSRLIQVFTPRLKVWRLAPSHVAVICWSRSEQRPSGAWFVWESTSLSKDRDGKNGSLRRGVQAHPLDEWLDRYSGTVILRPLKVPMPRVAEFRHYLETIHRRKVGYSWARALHTASPVRNSESGKFIVCSELVGYALQNGRSIGNNVNCCELHPLDVDNFRCLGPRIQLRPRKDQPCSEGSRSSQLSLVGG